MKKTMKSLTIMVLTFMLVFTMFSIKTTAIVLANEENSDIYEVLRGRFFDMVVGTEYDATDEAILPMIESIDHAAQMYWDNMNKNPISNAVNGQYTVSGAGDSSKDYIFPEYPLGWRNKISYESNSVHFTYQYLRSMAMAYQIEGCSLYKNEEMFDDIKMALEFMYENHFNRNTNTYGNWFSWELGGPIYLGETLLLLYDELGSELVQKYADPMKRFVHTSGYTGSNLSWNLRALMYIGLLMEDASYLTNIEGRLPSLIKYSTSGDGYYKDGTFVQHTNITYNGGYGMTCLTDTAYLLYMLSDTEWEQPQERNEMVFQFIIDSYEPIIFKGLCMDAFRGREITRTDTTQPRVGIIITNAMLMLAEMAPEAIANQFRGCIKEWFSNDFMIEQLNNSADTPWFKFPLDTVVKVNDILKDENIAPITFDGRTFQMSAGARTVHWSKEGWVYAISMSSPRINTYETGDSNDKGWYTGNGATYLYTKDIERYESVQKPTLDWYRYPGATSVYGRNQGGQANKSDFVGGVTDGTYGVSAMDLSMSTHNLKAKKSWFMFDDEVVALGSNISGQYDVETTLENYMIDENNRTYSIDGETKIMTMDASEIAYENTTTLHMSGNVEDSNIGFYFPNKLDINVKSETRSGKWTDLGEYNVDPTVVSADYFTVWSDHSENGNGTTDASYAYVLLPGFDKNKTQEYAGHSDIEILQQDENTHAVYDKTIGVLGVNFWSDQDNELDLHEVKNYVNSDSAASIMITDTDNGLDVSISDPTQKNDVITVEINRATKGIISADTNIEVIQLAPTTIFKVNVKNSAGKSFNVSFDYDDVDLAKTSIKSATMVDDALVVTLDKVPLVENYIVHYGTESGTYTNSVITKEATLNIYGLTPGTTYYLNAQSQASGNTSEMGVEFSFKVPETTAFYDTFDNMDKMLSYTSGWTTDSANGNKYNGDTTRIKRQDSLSKDSVQSFAYYLPGVVDFALEVYGYSSSIGTITIYTSEDGNEWNVQAHAEGGDTPKDDWYRRVITPEGAINTNANYIKVELSSHPTKTWAPQFTRFDAEIKATSDLKNVQDPLLNDSKIYSTENVEFTIVNNDEVAKAVENNAEVLYSWTNIQDGTITFYYEGNGGIQVSSSTDGETYKNVDVNEVKTESVGSYTKVSVKLPKMSDNTDFLKITLAEGTMLSDVSLHYKPENAEAKMIHFVDEKMDGVIEYNVTPQIKVAPMNATSSLIYASSDESVASVKEGIISFAKQGEANIVVQIDGSDVSDTLAVRVYKDLALGKSAKASPNRLEYTPNKAFDTDLIVSKWESTETLNEEKYIQVDLGKKSSFDAIDIHWIKNGENYKLMISNDGISWTTLKSVTAHPSGAYARYDFDTPVEARFVKMQGENNSQYSLSGLRVLQKTGSENSVEENPWNLALGKDAYVDSYDTQASNANQLKDGTNATDGNNSTRWASERSDNHWLYVDLGQPCNVESIRIFWEGASGKEYKLQISDNGKDWTDMMHITNNTVSANWVTHNLPQTYTGRYVRMLGVTRNTKYGFSMYEFEVYGTTVKEPWNLALNKKVTVSSSDTGNDVKVPAHITDGDESTRWASARSNSAANSQWFYVDLEKPYSIEEINIFWEASAGKEYKLQISNDGTNWTDMMHITNNTISANWATHILPQAQIGRYVRVLGIQKNNTKYGYSVWELEVMGNEISDDTVVEISSLAFDKESINLLKGHSASLSIISDPTSIPTSSLGWKTSDPTIVSVDATGKVTAKADSGSATITVYSIANPSVSAQCTVNINAASGSITKVEGITIGGISGSLLVGDRINLTAIVDPEDATFNHINWESSDESIVKVDANGAIVALKVGVATIYAKTTSGKESSVEICVVDKTTLEELLETIKTYEIKEEDYTTDSFDKFKNARDAAEAVLADVNVKQDTIEQATNELIEAYDTLVSVVKLKEAIAYAEAIGTTNYTAESVAVLEQVIEEAKALFANGTVETIEEAIASIEEAMNALKEKEEEKPVGPGAGDSTNVTGLLAILLASICILLKKKERKA